MKAERNIIRINEKKTLKNERERERETDRQTERGD